MLKLLVIAVSMLTFSQMLCSQDNYYHVEKRKLHSYLLIGQSNMAGRAQLLPQDIQPIKNAYILNREAKWETISKQPLNIYSTIRKKASMQRLSLGRSFVKTMLAGQPGISIGIISNAKGGTNIQKWMPGTLFFKEAVKRAKVAQKTSILKGILWHQGEANYKSKAYNELLLKIIKAFRKELNNKDLPFVAGQINNSPSFNRNILKMPKLLPYTAVASSQGLIATDRWHFDNKSMKILGRRYAEVMQGLLTASATAPLSE